MRQKSKKFLIDEKLRGAEALGKLQALSIAALVQRIF